MSYANYTSIKNSNVILFLWSTSLWGTLFSCYFCLYSRPLVALCLYHLKHFIRKTVFFILSSKESTRIEPHWPGLGHVFIPELFNPVEREYADWPCLDHLPTASTDRKRGGYWSAPLSRRGCPIGSQILIYEGGMNSEMAESTAIHHRA